LFFGLAIKTVSFFEIGRGGAGKRDTEADTRRINVGEELWDSFFADPVAKKKYGWFRRNAVPHWSLLEEAFGDRMATGSQAVGLSLVDSGRQRRNSPGRDEERGAQVDGDTPATAHIPVASTPPSTFATPVVRELREPGTDDDHDPDDGDDELEAPVSLPSRRKRSVTGETPAPKRAKGGSTSCQNISALGDIAEQLLAANLLREAEFQERRPSWKRAWEVIQDSYKTEWAKLTPGALGCLCSVLSQCPDNLSARASNVTYADLILAIGNDKRRDKYVRKVLKLATRLQEEELESSDGER